jgi:hypothetical protein
METKEFRSAARNAVLVHLSCMLKKHAIVFDDA